MKYCLIVLSVALFSLPAYSYKQQTGKISEFYVNADGSFALKLEGGFGDPVKEECSNNNGYAGSRTADPFLKSFYLAQYAANREVKIGFHGCDGAWIRIEDLRGYGN